MYHWGVQGTPDYMGDRVLREIRRSTREDSSLVVVSGSGAPSFKTAFKAAIGDETVRFLFANLGKLTVEDLLLARANTTDRVAYLAAMERFFINQHSATWLALTRAMECCFKKAVTAVLENWVRTGRLGKDPVGGPIRVEGDGNILKVVLPGASVHLSGIDLAGCASTAGIPTERVVEFPIPDLVQVIGRTITVDDSFGNDDASTV